MFNLSKLILIAIALHLSDRSIRSSHNICHNIPRISLGIFSLFSFLPKINFPVSDYLVLIVSKLNRIGMIITR